MFVIYDEQTNQLISSYSIATWQLLALPFSKLLDYLQLFNVTMRALCPAVSLGSPPRDFWAFEFVGFLVGHAGVFTLGCHGHWFFASVEAWWVVEP